MLADNLKGTTGRILKIGFTGTQRGMTQDQKNLVDAFLIWGREFHHGDCIGADAQAHEIAKHQGLRTVCHPPLVRRKRAMTVNDEERPPYDYLVRNRHIVDAVELLLVCPKETHEVVRSGTWSTYRYAKKIGRPCILIYPNGTHFGSNINEEVFHIARSARDVRTVHGVR